VAEDKTVLRDMFTFPIPRFCVPCQILVDAEMGRECSTHKVKRTHYKVLVRRPEKTTTRRSRRRWDGIKIDLKETGRGGMWIGFVWLRCGPDMDLAIL
jgi:hypothetical protein